MGTCKGVPQRAVMSCAASSQPLFCRKMAQRSSWLLGGVVLLQATNQREQTINNRCFTLLSCTQIARGRQSAPEYQRRANQTASSFSSPVRIRMMRSTAVTKILPSPILPVWALLVIRITSYNVCYTKLLRWWQHNCLDLSIGDARISLNNCDAYDKKYRDHYVITSYSIHYTKLYEPSSSVPLNC